jgi:hypothetical protein
MLLANVFVLCVQSILFTKRTLCTNKITVIGIAWLRICEWLPQLAYLNIPMHAHKYSIDPPATCYLFKSYTYVADLLQAYLPRNHQISQLLQPFTDAHSDYAY